MSTSYFVTFPEHLHEVLGSATCELPCPDVLPEPGETYRVDKPFYTRAGFRYPEGAVIKLIRRTDEAPFGYASSLGNWEVECPFQTSVWSNIECLVAEGSLSIVKVDHP